MAEIENKSGDGRWSLKGMNALVTGGTKGIGYAIVEELAGFGATVYTCSRKQEDLDKCIQEWKSKGYKVTGSVCDCSSTLQRQQLMEKVADYFNGKLHILVNNAATAFPRKATDSTAEDYSVIMSTNFEGPYHLSQLSHPLLKATGNGSIVFISSVAGQFGVPTLSLYSGSKGAINQLTKSLACEWAEDGIRVNGVAPWFVETPLYQEQAVQPAFTVVAERALERTPISREGKPNEISSLVAYLCLPAASWLTGQIITVDGGKTAYAF
ncbi:PREDICTED: tropinone reductase homolog isoform X1 [Ipomoea nil]|uniref:tropinone reductase homolog isoform X1 n=1 Tax=Ipomoea nil TaxID=35883 RepID=UPI0009016B84|nr:PREDICTED: tropinone reductase homolog isoform X1 [Ipomoea nil]